MYEVVAEFTCGLEDGFYIRFGEIKAVASCITKIRPRVKNSEVRGAEGQHITFWCRIVFSIKDQLVASQLADRLNRMKDVDVSWRQA